MPTSAPASGSPPCIAGPAAAIWYALTPEELTAAGVVAASGSFGNPHLPALPAQDTYGGEVRHVAHYRRPEPYAGKRVVVVGAGNSAVQVAHELAAHARVTLATRAPIQFAPQRVGGRDLHHWLRVTGADRLPGRFCCA